MLRNILSKTPKTLTLNPKSRQNHTTSITTKLLSFGDGSHGALGLPTSPIALGIHSFEPTIIPNLPPNITSIGAGHYHSLAVSSHGEIWAWGRNNELQLGRGDQNDENPSNWSEPRRVKGLEDVRVRDVFASGVVSAAIGVDGSLWVWGKSKRGQLGIGENVVECGKPTRVEGVKDEHIVKVSFGWGHALACTKDGKLFGWGYCADGRLGQAGENVLGEATLSSSSSVIEQGSSSSMFEIADKLVLQQMEKEKHMPIIWEPRLLQEAHGVGVTDIACGDDHSLVLCDDGTILSGGNNTYGQLGRSAEKIGLFAVDMNVKPLALSAGLGHSLAVCQIPTSQSNGILTWGWNSSSQLGRVGLENIPTMVHGLEGETPVSVSGGRVHSLALTSSGELWVWGCGKNGRLGLGSSANEVEPIMLDCLEGSKVIQAVCGYDHNLVLVAE